MKILELFADLEVAQSESDLSAVPLQGARNDFLAKSNLGAPVFLLRDASSPGYSPGIELRNVRVQFNCVCRVTVGGAVTQGQFAVVSCESDSPEMHELFIRSVLVVTDQLPFEASTVDLQRHLRSLLDLFRALGRPATREITGLWGELFVIAKSKSVPLALSVWRTDNFDRFDFSSLNSCLEVKTTVGERREHVFALEQLSPPLGGRGYVVSLLLQELSGGVGVIDLARDIEGALSGEIGMRKKLWQNIVGALGGDFSERLDRRFDLSYAERNLRIFDMRDVPTLPVISDPRVTSVQFRSDLSTVSSSLNGGSPIPFEELFS